MLKDVKVVKANAYEESFAKLKRGEIIALSTEKREEPKQEGITTYKVEVIGNKTIVTTQDGKVGEAKCAPDDQFDLGEGVKIAMERINEKYHKLSTTEKLLLNSLKSLNAVYVASHGSNISFRNENKQMLGVMGLPVRLFEWFKSNTLYEIDLLLENDR